MERVSLQALFLYFYPMKEPIRIQVDKKDNSPRAKRYKQFNTLLNKINQLKQELETLQEQVSSGLAFYQQEIKPLFVKQQDLMAEEVQALHRAYTHKIFGRKDREKIAGLILSKCENLFDAPDRDFAHLTTIYNHYASQTRAEREAEKKQKEQEMAEEILDAFDLAIDIDEEDDLEQILKKAQAAAAQKQQQEGDQATQDAKTEKQQLKEDRERQKKKDIQKVSKNIYSSLVRLLHPDRESDESKKAVKTAAIQRVNEAYERNDLFELLNLQAEYLQKEGSELTMLPEKEFKYYLQVLQVQQQELQLELNLARGKPGLEGYVFQNLCHPNPTTMQVLRQKAVRQEKEAIKSHQHNLKLAKDVEVLKEALRYFDLEEEAMEDDFGEIEQHRGKGKKKKKR